MAASGLGGGNYGYAGEWTDASGLQYLRARYYLPSTGRFISKDPFPGLQSQPSTLNAYAYVTNNPVLMSDPSGEIAPLLVAAGLGGLIGAGIDAGVQLYNMQPTSFGQAIRCLNWGEVGVSFGAGAVAGLTGFTVFSGATALMGTSFLANVAAGAISGVVAGQYGRLTELVLSGQISQAGTVLFRPQDMALDVAFGGLIGGVAYGVRSIRIQHIRRLLSEAATRAQATVGPGSGRSYGSRVHSAFSQEVRALGRPDLISEVSYRHGTVRPYGTRGSVRVDVVFGTRTNPIAVFDLKTGSASLTPSRILQIQSHLPTPNIPVFEVRP